MRSVGSVSAVRQEASLKCSSNSGQGFDPGNLRHSISNLRVYLTCAVGSGGSASLDWGQGTGRVGSRVVAYSGT